MAPSRAAALSSPLPDCSWPGKGFQMPEAEGFETWTARMAPMLLTLRLPPTPKQASNSAASYGSYEYVGAVLGKLQPWRITPLRTDDGEKDTRP